MNNDLISREVLKGLISDKSIPIKFEEEKRGDWQNSLGLLLSDIYKIIDNAPTVEPERPQGEWYFSCEKGWECNQCHEVVKEMPTCMRKATYNFCPNCGADMRGEKE